MHVSTLWAPSQELTAREHNRCHSLCPRAISWEIVIGEGTGYVPRSSCHVYSCPSPPAEVDPSLEIQNWAQPMSRRIIWIEDETFTGWCCSHCTWGFTAPRLESTVAALAFNRVAQEGFDKHDCTGSRNQEEARR